ncbi:hypothetical protein QUF72_12625 [Desulfobacterales bacterium HSG2]|nr:hypothetical protein [Desulfobacterales bacterium HSG2]
MDFPKVAFGVISMAILIFSAFPLIANTDSPSSQAHFIDFNKSQKTLSANFVNVDISDVARSLAERAGIKVFLDESLTCKLTSKFKDIPLEDGIKRLLGPTISSAIIFTKKKNPNGKARFRVDTVKIFKGGNILASFKEYNNKGMPSTQIFKTCRNSAIHF